VHKTTSETFDKISSSNGGIGTQIQLGQPYFRGLDPTQPFGANPHLLSVSPSPSIFLLLPNFYIVDPLRSPPGSDRYSPVMSQSRESCELRSRSVSVSLVTCRRTYGKGQGQDKSCWPSHTSCTSS